MTIKITRYHFRTTAWDLKVEEWHTEAASFAETLLLDIAKGYPKPGCSENYKVELLREEIREVPDDYYYDIDGGDPPASDYWYDVRHGTEDYEH